MATCSRFSTHSKLICCMLFWCNDYVTCYLLFVMYVRERFILFLVRFFYVIYYLYKLIHYLNYDSPRILHNRNHDVNMQTDLHSVKDYVIYVL